MKSCGNSARTDWVYFLASAAIVVLVFILSSYSVTEGDLFWHLKSGEWIFHHKAIPEMDPFAYSTALFPEPENAARQYTVLSSYWLGQIILYGVWSLGGYAGIVILRATVYALLISSLAFWVGRYSRGLLAISSILAAGATILPFSNERPQLFGFILFVLSIASLEAARNNRARFHPAVWCMPILLMIWSNIHGSFLLADALLVVYGVTHLVMSMLRRTDRSWSYLTLIGASLAASLVNPNSFTLVREFFRHYKTGIAGGVSEYISPIVMAWKYQIVTPYWVLVLVVIGILATRFKRMEWEHRLTLLLMLGISLNNLRYVPFFICVIPLSFIYLPARLEARWKIITVAVLLVVWAGTRPYVYSFTFMAHRQFPVDAVRFINETKPQGPLFNHIDWGGYVMFFSGRQVFCDGRYMVNSARKVHDLILFSPSGLELLDTYGISMVLIPGTNTFVNSKEYGKPWPLIEQLKKDGRWALVHYDDTALVFLRKFRGNDLLIMSNELPKSKIEENILKRMQWQRRK
jgi:hypothetical protein